MNKLHNDVMTAKFPDSNTRMQYLSQYKDDRESYGVAQDAIFFILNKVQAYTVKQYNLRDVAVEKIKEGNIEEALQILSQIGT